MSSITLALHNINSLSRYQNYQAFSKRPVIAPSQLNMAPFIPSFRSQNHSRKEKEKIKDAGRSDSSSTSSTSSNSASNVRPSPSSSSSSFSVLLPQTPAEPVSPIVEAAVMPESVPTYEVKPKPQYEGLRFSGAGPFPVLANNRHSVDPHGLSKYLMNPEDPIYDYMYPVPLRSTVDSPADRRTSSAVTATSARPDQTRRQSSFSVFGKKSRVASSPLAGPPTLENQDSCAGSEVDQCLGPFDVQQSNLVVTPGAPNRSLCESTTPTMSNRSLFPTDPEGSKPALETAETIAISSRSSSAESLGSRTAKSEVSTASDTTDNETKTPVFETASLPELHIQTHGDSFDTAVSLDTSEERTPTVPSKRPSLMSTSTWKTWLGVQKADKTSEKKLPVKKPKNLRPAPKISTSLSADPLSGTLPGSIPASTSTLVEEELHVSTQVSARDPECVQAMHRMTLDKLHAIRAVNTSHPAAVDIVDKASYQRNLQLNPAIAQLQSPRSSSPVIGTGSCIFPQADIFSIDVRLINILRKLDSRDFGGMQEIKHLSMSAIQARHDKQQRWSEAARLRKEGSSDIGIVKFMERPCFEDRMLDFDSNLRPRPVQSARNLAMLEPEFTPQTQGWVELSKHNQLKRVERLGGFVQPQSLVRRSVSRSRSTSTLGDHGSSLAIPYDHGSAAKHDSIRSRSPAKAIARSSSTLSLWAPTKRSDRRQAPIDEDEDTESSDSDGSDSDTPLSTMRRPPVNAFTSSHRTSANHPVQSLQSRSRPPSTLSSLTTPQLLSGPSSVASTNIQPRRPVEDPAKYRQEYLKVRDRIEKARKGETERERGGEAIRQRTHSTQKAVPTTGKTLVRGAAKDLRIETEKKANRAGSASAPTSPRKHSRQISHPQMSGLSTGNAYRPGINGHPSQPGLGAHPSHAAANSNLARRSLSHADVRNSMGFTYGMPGMVAPFSNQPQAFMYMPVPVMPFAPMVNPYGMQMPSPQMMVQPLPGQRRQSAMEAPRAAHVSASQQRPTAPRVASRHRLDGREPVR